MEICYHTSRTQGVVHLEWRLSLGLQLDSYPALQCPLVPGNSSAGGCPSLERILPLALLTIAGRLEDWVEGRDGFPAAAHHTSLPSSICGELRRRQHCFPLISPSVSQVSWDGGDWVRHFPKEEGG